MTDDGDGPATSTANTTDGTTPAASQDPLTVRVLDAHQHFWRYNDREYGWMDERMDRLRRDHLPEHLGPLLVEAGVHGTVAVQARRALAETAWLLELAARVPYVRGVVGWFDLASDGLDAELERFASDPALVGVRELIHDMPDPDYATSDTHVKAIARLARHGLTYDLLLRPQHLPAATRLVDRFPDQRFVIDHAAKPRVARGELEPWATWLAAIAERPNVFCKLSGLFTEADWARWRPSDLWPYVEHVLACFGPERVMVGSDWPVSTCAADYATGMGVLADFAAELSEDERAAVMGATCSRFYRLPSWPEPPQPPQPPQPPEPPEHNPPRAPGPVDATRTTSEPGADAPAGGEP